MWIFFYFRFRHDKTTSPDFYSHNFLFTTKSRVSFERIHCSSTCTGELLFVRSVFTIRWSSKSNINVSLCHNYNIRFLEKAFEWRMVVCFALISYGRVAVDHLHHMCSWQTRCSKNGRIETRTICQDRLNCRKRKKIKSSKRMCTAVGSSLLNCVESLWNSFSFSCVQLEPTRFSVRLLCLVECVTCADGKASEMLR